MSVRVHLLFVLLAHSVRYLLQLTVVDLHALHLGTGCHIFQRVNDLLVKLEVELLDLLLHARHRHILMHLDLIEQQFSHIDDVSSFGCPTLAVFDLEHVEIDEVGLVHVLLKSIELLARISQPTVCIFKQVGWHLSHLGQLVLDLCKVAIQDSLGLLLLNIERLTEFSKLFFEEHAN